MKEIIFILCVINVIFLSLKLKKTRNLSLLGSIFSRFYLLYVVIICPLKEEIFIAIILILFSDSLNSFISFYAEKLLGEKEQRLIQKLSSTIDNSLTPFFTINEQGVIEYSNASFSSLFPVRNLKEIIPDPLFSTFVNSLRLETEIDTPYGKREALFIGNKTINGHATITGGIYFPI